jgi:hypothetical protein
MPDILFCTSFYNKVTHKMSICFKSFIKFTDGQGMPVSKTRRYWPGKNASNLIVDIINDRRNIVVKSGFITCPNGDMKDFQNPVVGHS